MFEPLGASRDGHGAGVSPDVVAPGKPIRPMDGPTLEPKLGPAGLSEHRPHRRHAIVVGTGKLALAEPGPRPARTNPRGRASQRRGISLSFPTPGSNPN